MSRKVSIIVPAYNVETYIHRAIASCLEQTEPDWELILVDDGSSDGTWEVICSFQKQDSRILAYRQENAGVSAARNQGLKMATGAFVLFLDSDDWLEPDALQQLLKMQAQSPKMLICADCYYAYPNSAGGIDKYPAETELDNKECFGTEALAGACEIKCKIRSACYKLFSAEIIRKYAIQFDTSLSFGEDGLFVFEYLSQVEGYVYKNLPLWNILERPGSATTGGYTSKRLTAIDAVEKMKQRTGDAGLINQLTVFQVNRALTAQHNALRLKKLPMEDIRYIRSVLRKYRGEYLASAQGLYKKCYYLAMAYGPVGVISFCVKRR